MKICWRSQAAALFRAIVWGILGAIAGVLTPWFACVGYDLLVHLLSIDSRSSHALASSGLYIGPIAGLVTAIFGWNSGYASQRSNDGPRKQASKSRRVVKAVLVSLLSGIIGFVFTFILADFGGVPFGTQNGGPAMAVGVLAFWVSVVVGIAGGALSIVGNLE